MAAVKQKIIAVSGVKNSGKTTLIRKLIPVLRARGVSAAVIKHDGHSFDPDRAGTDTCRIFEAGAVVSEADLIACFPEADVILLEGFKWTDYPKVEIVRRGVSDRPVCDPDTLLALVTDTDACVPGVPVYAPDEIDGIAARILEATDGN